MHWYIRSTRPRFPLMKTAIQQCVSIHPLILRTTCYITRFHFIQSQEIKSDKRRKKIQLHTFASVNLLNVMLRILWPKPPLEAYIDAK